MSSYNTCSARWSGQTLLQAPAIEPLTIQEVMTHLRLDSTNLEPVPSAPTVALAGAGAGNVNAGAHRYRVTFVTADGETDGGDISASVTTTGGDGKVQLSNIALGGSKVTQRKIYRTIAGGAAYLFLATLADNTTTAYLDNIADAGLGAAIPSVNTTADPQLSGLIQTARELAERWLGRALITQKWRIFYDEFFDIMYLPYPPLITVDAFKYKLAGSGALTDVLAAVYTADVAALPGRILRNYAQSWPSVYEQSSSIYADITCGYGPARANVPQGIKDGMKILIGGLYENPQAYGTEAIDENPVLKRVWRPFRYQEF